MRRIIAGIFGLVFIAQTFAAASDPAPKPEEQSSATEESETRALLKSIHWTRGPGDANIGSYAKIKVPEGFMFTSGEGTRKLMEAMGNPTNDSELGFLSPTNLQ